MLCPLSPLTACVSSQHLFQRWHKGISRKKGKRWYWRMNALGGSNPIKISRPLLNMKQPRHRKMMHYRVPKAFVSMMFILSCSFFLRISLKEGMQSPSRNSSVLFDWVNGTATAQKEPHICFNNLVSNSQIHTVILVVELVRTEMMFYLVCMWERTWETILVVGNEMEQAASVKQRHATVCSNSQVF